MTPKATGAETLASSGGTLLVRVHWKDGADTGHSLRIVRPLTLIEQTLFQDRRLSPKALKRASVVAYSLIPVVIALNAVAPQDSRFASVMVLGLTCAMILVALEEGVRYFLGAGLVDRLHAHPLTAMKAPATPAPLWWSERLEELPEDAITAFQRAYLALEVTDDRIREGESLLGQFLPSEPSYQRIEMGLDYLRARKKALTALLSTESFTPGHLREMVMLASERAIPEGVAKGSVADGVRDWVNS